MDETKKCYKCGEVKLRSEFYKNRCSRSGLQSECKTCDIERRLAWRERNRCKDRAAQARYDKSKKGQARLKRQKLKRQKALRRATPKWLTQEQRMELALFYSNCPEGYSCDHFLPILGKEICGLNVTWNLRYVSKEENSKKGNLFTPYTEVFEQSSGGTKNACNISENPSGKTS